MSELNDLYGDPASLPTGTSNPLSGVQSAVNLPTGSRNETGAYPEANTLPTDDANQVGEPQEVTPVSTISIRKGDGTWVTINASGGGTLAADEAGNPILV